jgi:FkbM family methyltransferase
MISKILWLLRGYASLLNFRKLGVFQEAYKFTRFDAAFTPSWSQAGEDISLEMALQSGDSSHFYLDIGAHDPNRFSVTRKLYQSGWIGLDIDGNPNYEAAFKKHRPKNQFLNVCVGFKSEYEFSIFAEGAISTTNSEWVKKFQSEGNAVEKTIVVPGMKLRELLDLPGVPQRVGFINIDIEGADEEALRSIGFETLSADRYPTWILLETAPPVGSSLEFPAVRYAVEHGYIPWLVLPMATLLKSSK